MKDSITLTTGDGETIRMSADTAAFLLSFKHALDTEVRFHRQFAAEDRLAEASEAEAIDRDRWEAA